MLLKIIFPSIFLLGILSCAGTVSDFQKSTTSFSESANANQKQLQALDTGQMTIWMLDAKRMLQTLKPILTKDTLDIQSARELDRFVIAYKSCKTFHTSWLSANAANDSLKLRLEILKKDLETGAGDRSGYQIAINKEGKEVKILNQHIAYLDSLYTNFDKTFTQFKPIFERLNHIDL